MKTRVAVFFGGRSPEHDVSIVTGLQAIQALNQQTFSVIPVYVGIDGTWFTGDALRERGNYLPNDAVYKQLQSVLLDMSPSVDGHGRLLPTRARQGLFKAKPIEFDIALLAFHGLFGEDGRFQSLFEIANVPYTGMRSLASSVFMDKVATKRILAGTGISVLPYAVLDRPKQGYLPTVQEVTAAVGDMRFPLIVKPVHLGSSIGVARVEDLEQLRTTLPSIFKIDPQAMVEPFVENLVEYNVCARRVRNRVVSSAIERPKTHQALLDFRAKYLSSQPKQGGTKQAGTISQGMLSLTRDINPTDIPANLVTTIRGWAATCFSTVSTTGAPRIDFLVNGKTNEAWLNEVNPCPGSFGYFLWEAAEEPVLFSELLSSFIDEGMAAHQWMQLPADPTDPVARLFSRR